jgi:NAD(P)-dependent dehydrogenase (short-subunit alcohol dehydrogenase family)
MGLVAAHAFAQSGAALVLADVNEPELQAASGDLTGAGHQAIAVSCDVSDEGQVAAMVEQAMGRFGRLDMAAKWSSPLASRQAPTQPSTVILAGRSRSCRPH